MINVIWIDDNSRDIFGQPTNLAEMIMDEAYEFGIKVEPFLTYEEGIQALKKEPNFWDAVILDVRDERAEQGDTLEGFQWAKKEIFKFQEKMKDNKPYLFVFSGVDQFVSDSGMIIGKKDRDYARKRVYAKPSDSRLMFKDIKVAVENSDLYQLREKFEDIFKCIEQLNWESDEQKRLFKLMYWIDARNESTNDELFTDIRKLLEGPIMRVLLDLGVFPKDTDTLNKRCRFIGKSEFKNYIPIYIQRSFHSLGDICNNGSHVPVGTEGGKDLIVVQDTFNGRAPYLLKSCLFELMNIIIWESCFCREYADVEKNRKIFCK